MKEFLDSTAGRTLIIAAIAAGTTVFAVPWDGAETVLRAAGGAFFGALAPLVFYLKKNEADAAEATRYGQELSDRFDEEINGPVVPRIYVNSTSALPANITVTPQEVKDFDKDYHFVDSGRHAGKLVDCADCRA